METPHTYIFIGRSGCGKGTQAEFLRKKLSESRFPIFNVQTGNIFREFIQGSGITPERSRHLMDIGARQPDFLAIWVWASILMKRETLDEHWLFDGAPRGLSEAMALETAMEFYSREKPAVVYLNCSKEWAVERLVGRGRADDKREEIENRQAFFDLNVIPAVEFFRTSPNCHFFDINGEQTPEEVEKEITEKLQQAGNLY